MRKVGRMFPSFKKHFLLCFRRKRSTVCEKKDSELLSSQPCITSKEIRNLFVEYFVKEKNHVYVPSSSVFLNNDPSLLFVNAGMNQFKSKLLDKVSPKNNLYHIKRAANTQKCVRMSGKHNDFSCVGLDFHHHTFFEMLGNWSFGDYFKKEACEMSWELLTKVYGLQADRLYITYFGGDEKLRLPEDLECRNIWLNIGVKEDHIIHFGAKENFWDMGDSGPCGPCSEIHYDFMDNSNRNSLAKNRINAGRSDLVEIWNLVFIQYNRTKDGILEKLDKFSVDTGMGFERLTAVLQRKKSNYDTDIFSPLFKAIENNFKIRPYEGKLGENDSNQIDTAYRIISDHARMFSVSIADGLFPDSFNAGHVLRKVIRRAAYMANRVMKTQPGMLSTLVPYVAETLDFYPEIEKNSKEIMTIIDEEEKLFHSIINKGRKVRNRIAIESKDKILDATRIYQLRNSYGLEDNVIQDLADEINFKIDWAGYKKLVNEKNDVEISTAKFRSETILPTEVLKILKNAKIFTTDDSFKYNIDSEQRLSANILAIIKENQIVNDVDCNQSCFVITDKTNFYSEAGGQVSDIGEICNENFSFDVEDVQCVDSLVLHKGTVTKGRLASQCDVVMIIDKKHRNKCACNHTATHLVNAALQNILPYTGQRSSYVGPSQLKFGFSSKAVLTEVEIMKIENFVRNSIHDKLSVHRTCMSFDELQSFPNATFLQGEEYPHTVSVIMIGDKHDESALLSVEPCCGTHVQNVSDLEEFAIVQSKSLGGSTKTLNAVTSEIAKNIRQNGEKLKLRLKDIENRFSIHKAENGNNSPELVELLKDVRKFLSDCHFINDVPHVVLKNCEVTLKEIRLKLMDLTNCKENEPAKELVKKSRVPQKYLEILQKAGVKSTADSQKYEYSFKNTMQSLSAKIVAIFQNDSIVQNANRGQHCIVVTDRTNFFAEDLEQAGDKGAFVTNECTFNVTDVYEKNGFVFHEGWIEDGTLKTNCDAMLHLDEKHRNACSLNHTAMHILSASLRNVLDHYVQQSAFARASELQLEFKSKPLTLDQIQEIERSLNSVIEENYNVVRTKVPAEDLRNMSSLTLPQNMDSSDPVSIITITSMNSDFVSIEPCCGTHAEGTLDIGNFLIVSSRRQKDNSNKIRAVTGLQAKEIIQKGEIYSQEMSQIENRVLKSLELEEPDYLEMWDLLKEVKSSKNRHETDLPFVLFRKHQDLLSELTVKLSEATKRFIQNGFSEVKREMESLTEKFVDDRYVIYKLNSLGDGKKLINFALGNVTDKPAMFIAADGHKSIVCSCSVPKSFTSSSFSALLWIQPLATFLNGRARFHTKDPELFYSIESNDVDNVREAMDIARKFIESN